MKYTWWCSAGGALGKPVQTRAVVRCNWGAWPGSAGEAMQGRRCKAREEGRRCTAVAPELRAGGASRALGDGERRQRRWKARKAVGQEELQERKAMQRGERGGARHTRL